MSPDTASEVKFEIGHFLFIDIVGYSKLLITQQSELLDVLKRVVRGTEQHHAFRSADALGMGSVAERSAFSKNSGLPLSRRRSTSKMDRL